jgi:hypothetical protein
MKGNMHPARVKDGAPTGRRYFRIAGITIEIAADRPITSGTFAPKFEAFRVDGPGEDTISIHHRFGLPDLGGRVLGRLVLRHAPWAVYQQPGGWLYLGIAVGPDDHTLSRVAELTPDHRQCTIFNADDRQFCQGGLQSLTMFPTDQIVLARVLADRQACYLHSSAAVIDGAGLVFVGHSDAGKSTTARMLAGHAEVLCDDRNVVRRWPDGFRVHGSWSHGEIPHVSAASAPLAAILLLAQSTENRLVRLDRPMHAAAKLAACIVKPLADAGWWDKSLRLVETLVAEVPCYEMHFDKSGEIVPVLVDLAARHAPSAAK